MRLSRVTRGKRHAHRYRQSVPEGTGREFYPRYVMADVAHQLAFVPVVSIHPSAGKEAKFGQHGVDGSASVPLAEKETVAFRMVRGRGIHL